MTELSCKSRCDKLQIATVCLLFVAFFLSTCSLAFAQADPLKPSNMPVIDTKAADYPANIWVTDTMQKVLQDSGTPGPNHWGLFYGTQGEFVDFQVHFHDTGSGTSGLNISVGSFVQSSPNSYTIPTPSTSNPGTIVYREAYYDVTTVSNPGGSSYSFYGSTGYYPDPLIPEIDPYYHQVTDAFPVTVAASQNQSAWIDVFIPFAAPSGYYKGTVTVQTGCSSALTGCTTIASLPIVIAVWQWPSSGHMPATSSHPSDLSFGTGDFCNMNYPGGLWNSTGCNAGTITYPGGEAGTNADGGAIALDHRWSMFDKIDGDVPTYYAGYFSGTTLAGRPNTIIPGAKPTSVGSNNIPIYWPTISSYNTYMAANYPSILTFEWQDEPQTSGSWTTVCTDAASNHALTPPLRMLATTWWQMMTSMASVTPCLPATQGAAGISNAVDIIVVDNQCLEPTTQWDACSNQDGSQYPPAGLRVADYSTWLSHTNPDGITPKLWSYLACGDAATCGGASYGPSGYPNYDIDGKPTGNRVVEWLDYLHGQAGTLYYFSTCAWETSCSGISTDPWTTQLAFGNQGDGTLFYPSRYAASSTNHVAQQSGAALTTPIWVPSVRLKHMRDGMQDYEYLNVLTNNGQGSLVQTEISSWITNSYTFETTGTGLQNARLALGTAMHQLTHPAVLQPPPTLKGTLQ